MQALPRSQGSGPNGGAAGVPNWVAEFDDRELERMYRELAGEEDQLDESTEELGANLAATMASLKQARREIEQVRQRIEGRELAERARLGSGAPRRGAWLLYGAHGAAAACLAVAAAACLAAWRLPGPALALLAPAVLALGGCARLLRLARAAAEGGTAALLLAWLPLAVTRGGRGLGPWRRAFVAGAALLQAAGVRHLAPPSVRDPAVASDAQLWRCQVPVDHAWLRARDQFAVALDGAQVWRHLRSGGIPLEPRRGGDGGGGGGGKDLYETLGVGPLAGAEEIEEAARRLGFRREDTAAGGRSGSGGQEETVFYPFDDPPQVDFSVSRVDTAVNILTNDLYRCVYDAKNGIVGRWDGWEGACYELWHREAERMRRERRRETWLGLGFTEEVIEAAEARRASILEPRTRRRQEAFEEEKAARVAAK